MKQKIRQKEGTGDFSLFDLYKIERRTEQQNETYNFKQRCDMQFLGTKLKTVQIPIK